MLTRAVGQLVTRRPWLVLGVFAVLVAVAAIVGASAPGRLSSGGFFSPDAESSRAADVLDEEFGTLGRSPDFVMVVDAGTDVDDPAVAAAGRALTDALAAEPGVGNVASHWSLELAPMFASESPLRSADGTKALIFGVIEGDIDTQIARATELQATYEGDFDGLQVSVGGSSVVFEALERQSERDLLRAELIALPLTLLLLLVVFRSVVAAVLPLVVGAVAIAGTLFLLWVLTQFSDVSVFALNLTTAMSLGLGIDYSLLVVSRFREELHREGAEPDRDQVRAAVLRTIATSGRTVTFSVLTVAVSIATLFVFPIPILHSVATAGIAVATLLLLASVVVMPAILMVLGPRVDMWSVRRDRVPPDGHGGWYRVAKRVMRHPWSISIAVIGILIVAGLPFLHVSFGLPDDRVLPPGAPEREVTDELRTDFDTRESGALRIVSTELDQSDTEAIAAYGQALSQVEGVARVDTVAGSFIDGVMIPVIPGTEGLATLTRTRAASDSATWINVVPDADIEPYSEQGEAWVADVRAVPAPAPVLIAGPAAELADSNAILRDRLPWALALIALATVIVLFLLSGSVLIPLKALAINTLSLTACFGSIVWIFQDGNWSDALDFTPTGSINAVVPILMFCLAFGLSMDYEVFLISRIKEEWDRSKALSPDGVGDNDESIAVGLERSGRVVTAAALIIAVVMFSFASSGVAFVKMLGIGLGLAVLVDAFIIRATLVPALLHLAGPANWWAPKWLRRVHDKVGISEAAADSPREALTPAGPPG